MRLIDANALDDDLKKEYLLASDDSMLLTPRGTIIFNLVLDRVRCIAMWERTIDAEPVRHGRWIIKHYNFTFCEYEMVPYDATRMDNPSGNLYCSECNAEALLNGHEEDVPSRYCPNCGAKMDGGAEGEESKKPCE